MPQNSSKKLFSRPLFGGIVLAIIVLAALLAQLRDARQPQGPEHRQPANASQTDAPSHMADAAASAPNTERSVPSATTNRSSAIPQLGKLRRLRGDVYESTAGLIYGPGSREGHRLKHVLLHTADQPSRPGKHGVFLGGREGTLATIDRAYQLAVKGAPGVRTQAEGKRMVYTVDLGKTIGYVGGRDGKRHGRPRVHHVRLVLEGKRVITAFPVAP